MDDGMKEMCENCGVDFYALLDKITVKGTAILLNNHTRTFTTGELDLLRNALEIAGGV